MLSYHHGKAERHLFIFSSNNVYKIAVMGVLSMDVPWYDGIRIRSCLYNSYPIANLKSSSSSFYYYSTPWSPGLNITGVLGLVWISVKRWRCKKWIIPLQREENVEINLVPKTMGSQRGMRRPNNFWWCCSLWHWKRLSPPVDSKVWLILLALKRHSYYTPSLFRATYSVIDSKLIPYLHTVNHSVLLAKFAICINRVRFF